jgi:hypothetical protein
VYSSSSFFFLNIIIISNNKHIRKIIKPISKFEPVFAIASQTPFSSKTIQSFGNPD